MVKRKDNKGRVLRKGESQRKDLTYMYRWTDLNQERRCIYANSLNELRKEEEVIANELAKGISRNSNTLNIQIEQYLDTKVNIEKSTAANYKHYYEHTIRDSFLGKMKIKDIKKAHILKFYKNCHEKDMANNTIAILQKIIRPALQLAVDSDILLKNPANECLKDYPVEKEVKYALSFDQENEFLSRFDICPNAYVYKSIAGLLLYTGLRISELLGLTWADVDMSEKTININHQMVCKTIDEELKLYCTKNTKTVSGNRIVQMNDLAYQYMLRQREYWLSCKKDLDFSVDGYTDFVFISNRTGRVVRHAVVRRLFRKIVKEYNEKREIQLPAISPHILRHKNIRTYKKFDSHYRISESSVF